MLKFIEQLRTTFVNLETQKLEKIKNQNKFFFFAC